MDYSGIDLKICEVAPYSAECAKTGKAWAEVVVGGNLSMWIYRIFYILDLCLIKISILLFYNYVTSVHKSFHRIVKTLMIIVIASSIAMIIAAIFACNPPSDAWSFKIFWDSFFGIYPKQCYNPSIIWYVSASFTLVTDCIIWILPIPFILNLQSMPARRRLELAGIFSIGIVAIAASSVRLWVLSEWLSSFKKQEKLTGNLLIWGQVEQHAAIIAASIPFLRPLVRKALKQKEGHHPTPSPVARLVHPIRHRTPIIPSPSPTFGSSSDNSPFKAPPSPLSPIPPMNTSLPIGSAV